MGRFNPRYYIDYLIFKHRAAWNRLRDFLHFSWPSFVFGTCLLFVLSWLWQKFEFATDVTPTSSVIGNVGVREFWPAGWDDDLLSSLEASAAVHRHAKQEANERRSQVVKQLRLLAEGDRMLCSFSDLQLINAAATHPESLRKRIPLLDRYPAILKQARQFDQRSAEPVSTGLAGLLIQQVTKTDSCPVTIGSTAEQFSLLGSE